MKPAPAAQPQQTAPPSDLRPKKYMIAQRPDRAGVMMRVGLLNTLETGTQVVVFQDHPNDPPEIDVQQPPGKFRLPWHDSLKAAVDAEVRHLNEWYEQRVGELEALLRQKG